MRRKIIATFYSKDDDEDYLLSTMDELENGNRVWVLWKEYGRFTEVRGLDKTAKNTESTEGTE